MLVRPRRESQVLHLRELVFPETHPPGSSSGALRAVVAVGGMLRVPVVVTQAWVGGAEVVKAAWRKGLLDRQFLQQAWGPSGRGAGWQGARPGGRRASQLHALPWVRAQPLPQEWPSG